MMKTLPIKLAKNEKLHRELLKDMRPAIIEEASPRPGMIPLQFPFRGQKLHDLLVYLAKGLLWHHWQVVLGPEFVVRAISLTSAGQGMFESLVGRYALRTVSNNLGEGTIRYEGAQARGYPEFSFWGFSIFGGIRFHGESGAASTRTKYHVAVTGRADVFSDLEVAKLLI